VLFPPITKVSSVEASSVGDVATTVKVF